MTIGLLRLIADEISLKNNHINFPPNTQIKFDSQFNCHVQKNLNGNPNLTGLTLTFLSLTSEQNPKPFDLRVAYTGIFEGEFANQEEEKQFVTAGIKEIYPHIRAAVSALTTSANSPVLLPIKAPDGFAPNAPAQENAKPQKDMYVFQVDDKLN